jgi:hypothetical protein
MRQHADRARIHAFLDALGRAAREPGELYLTGGATAVLVGWRATTLDIDLRLEPDPDALLRRISELKNELDINVELASPSDFIPALPGWRERSLFVAQTGHLAVRHLDPYSQALSKVERGFEQDLADVAEMVRRGLVEPARALALFDEIEGELFRYPAIDPAAFRAKVQDAFALDA